MSSEQPKRVDFVDLIPLDQINPDPNPLRQTLSQQHIEDIMESLNVLKMGPLDALVVKPLENGQYQIISGNHRYQALKQGGWMEAPCHIIEPLSDAEEFLMKLHTNTRRKNLNELELCEAMAREKEIYEAFYPETKHGKNKRTEGLSESVKFSHSPNSSYVQVKSKEMGIDPSTIRRDIKIGKVVQQMPELKETQLTKDAVYHISQWKQDEKLELQKQLQMMNDKAITILKHLGRKKRKKASTHKPDTFYVPPPSKNPYKLILKIYKMLRRGINWQGVPIACQWELVQEDILLNLSRLLTEEHHRIKIRTNPPDYSSSMEIIIPNDD